MTDPAEDAPRRRPDALAAFARSLTVAGLAKSIALLGAAMAALATYRLVTVPYDGVDLRAWVRLACALAWLGVGTWVLRGAARRRADWRARGRAPLVVMVSAFVIGPVAASLHGTADLADLVQTVLTGPALGTCMLLDGLLMREAVGDP